jgi:hypothetical protein
MDGWYQLGCKEMNVFMDGWYQDSTDGTNLLLTTSRACMKARLHEPQTPLVLSNGQ